MKTAILYARYSPRPDGAESESIEMQLEKCRAYCLAHDYKVVATFEDRELSGARADNRPGLQNALKACCQHKSTLVAYSLSRVARNAKDTLDIADLLQKCDANLALLDLNLDTTSAMGRCVLTILAAVAELERNQIAQRTSDAMQRHQRNGKRMSRYAPAGYTFDENGRIVKDPTIDEVVTTARYLQSLGWSHREIAAQLQAQSGRRWHHQTVQKLLALPLETETCPG